MKVAFLPSEFVQISVFGSFLLFKWSNSTSQLWDFYFKSGFFFLPTKQVLFKFELGAIYCILLAKSRDFFSFIIKIFDC